MRPRIGYGGPREYRHGQYFPGGRRNNGGLTEIERLIHLIASMQILFGSRRGGALIPLLIIGVLVGGWFLYRHNYSPEVALERHVEFLFVGRLDCAEKRVRVFEIGNGRKLCPGDEANEVVRFHEPDFGLSASERRLERSCVVQGLEWAA
jgi:hypothetical protein